MPYNKTSSGLEPNPATKLVCQMMLKSSLTVSLIAGLLIPSLSNSTQATASIKKTENNIRDRHFRAVSKVKLNTKNKSKTTLTNSNLVGSVRTLIANLSSLPSKEYSVNSKLNRAKLDSTSIESKTANGDRGAGTILANQNLAVSPDSMTEAAKPTQVHIVNRGDTVSKIAQRYGVSKDDLVKLNQLKNSNVIFVSQRLEIPTPNSASVEPLQNTLQQSTQVTSSVPVKTVNKYKASGSNPSDRSSVALENPYLTKLKAEIEQSQKQSPYRNSIPGDRLQNIEDAQPKIETVSLVSSSEASNFQQISLPEDSIALQLPPLPPSDEYLPSAFDGYIWPAQGVLTSGYGWRWGRMHRGIDIAAPIGTPIVAAASGTVINVGWQSGYGNLVKLKHLDGSVTVYAHNHKNLVSHGQQVDQGEQIAEMGNTGRSTGSHVHFEIRLPDKAAIDPLALLESKK